MPRFKCNAHPASQTSLSPLESIEGGVNTYQIPPLSGYIAF